MRFFNTFLLLVLILLNGNAFAGVVTITDEDFEGGASGWSNNSTDNTYPGSFTEFLGRFGAGTSEPVEKTFPINSTVSTVTISFDFYEIDSWDFELFNVYVNGELISSHDFKHNIDDVPRHGLPRILPGDIDGNQNIGFNATWPDQGYHYEFEMNMSTDLLTLGFETTIGSSLTDESYGIDNVVITQEIPDSVPVPFTPMTWILLVLALATMGTFALKRRVLAS